MVRSALGVLVIAGCGSAAVTPAVAAPTRSPEKQMVDDVTAALQRHDGAAATQVIERARHAAPPVGAEALAYYDATVHAYAGDVRGALRILHDHAARVGPTAQAAFSFHDAMIALRTADGDVLGAVVEAEEMVRAGTLGTWSPADRMTWVQLKQHWHRAYLLRMAAQTRTGAERDAFLDYAEHARRDYAALAGPMTDTADSIAVLDAYFAFCDGDAARMRAAAQRVDVAHDDDVEDLYLVQLALDGAGDRAAAAAVRQRIAHLPFVTVLAPVFLAWLRSDAAASEPGTAPAFSPAHPAGARPAR